MGFTPFEKGTGFSRFLYELKSITELKYYNLALISSLCIPDICGGIDSPDNKATGADYRKWFNKYMSKYVHSFDGDECYKLRCSALHQGLSTHGKSKW